MVLGGLAILSGLRSPDASEPATKPAEIKRAPPPDPHDTPLPTQAAGAGKLRQAMAIWTAFDQLPTSQKTKDKLTDTLDSAAQVIKAEPRSSDDKKNLAQQGMEFRKRAAPLASPGARATDESFTTLVPSDDPTRCVELGQAWSADGANMAQLGFRRIECVGKSPKVWEIKP